MYGTFAAYGHGYEDCTAFDGFTDSGNDWTLEGVYPFAPDEEKEG